MQGGVQKGMHKGGMQGGVAKRCCRSGVSWQSLQLGGLQERDATWSCNKKGCKEGCKKGCTKEGSTGGGCKMVMEYGGAPGGFAVGGVARKCCSTKLQ